MSKCNKCKGKLKRTDAAIYIGEGSNWMNEPHLIKLIYQCTECGALEANGDNNNEEH